MFMIVFLLLLSAIVGILGGLTGTGGVLIPPVLIGLFGMDTHVALGTTQATFIIPSLFAVWLFLRKGQVDWVVSVSLSAGGLLFAFVGAEIKSGMSAPALALFLSFCIIASGAVLLYPMKKQSRFLEGTLLWRASTLFVLGSAVGLLGGITGSGTNAILVPAMLYAGINPLVTLAAGQFYSVFVSCSGTLGNVLNNAIDLWSVLWLTIGQLMGMYVGVTLAQRMQTQGLKRAVAFVCMATGIFIMVQAFYRLAQS